MANSNTDSSGTAEQAYDQDAPAGEAAQHDKQQHKPSSKPTWAQELDRNLQKHRKDPTAKFMWLATTDTEGHATCRTVVYRGFQEQISGPADLASVHYIKTITDRRSNKVQHLALQPHAEVCWYFRDTREQIRVKGLLRLITAEESDPQWAKARVVMWKNLSDNAREQFYWQRPGEHRDWDDDTTTGSGHDEQARGADDEQRAEEPEASQKQVTHTCSVHSLQHSVTAPALPCV